jgi:polyhydroxyalkanoate synthesis regulator phasin
MKQSPDARKKAEMIKREAQAKAIAKAKVNIPDQYKKSVEQYYSNLKAQQENLKEKESEIESMRREIRELRKLVEKMSKDKD